ncbi:MAG: hypothetical protein KBC46_05110 [Ferrovibrio sp.]|nr:hypothetical protein [Ferrovibrio sp.]
MNPPNTQPTGKAAIRLLMEMLAQATPVTAALAHLYGYTHPDEMQRAIQRWQAEITAAVNDTEARITALEAKLHTRQIIGNTAVEVAAWFIKNSKDGMMNLYDFVSIQNEFSTIQPGDLREALYELQHNGFVICTAAIVHPIARVRIDYNLYWTFDPPFTGNKPEQDAGALAKLLLENSRLSATRLLHEASGWEKRRFNPAIAYLLQYVDDDRVSREIQNNYPTSSFIMTDEERFKFKQFLRSLPEPVIANVYNRS